MRRNTKFKEFFLGYVRFGMLIAVIIWMVIPASYYLYYYGKYGSSLKKKGFYSYLQGEKPKKEDFIEAKRLMVLLVKIDKVTPAQIARITKFYRLEDNENFRYFLENRQEIANIISSESKDAAARIPVPAYLGRLAQLRSLGLGLTYLILFLDNQPEIASIINGETTDAAAKIIIPDKKNFLTKNSLSWAYLIMAVCMTGDFVLTSFLNDERLRSWPWAYFWAYPTIVFMAPALVPAIAIEALVRLEMRLWRLLTGARQAIMAPVEKQRDPMANWTMNAEDRQKFEEDWLRISRQDFKKERDELEKTIREQRQRLESLGLEMTATQRAWAESKSKLEKWDEKLATRQAKQEDDHRQGCKNFLRLPQVIAAKVITEDNMDHLLAFVDTIYIIQDSSKYRIGAFIVRINTATGHISLENVSSTHPLRYCHPYAYDRNDFCWGDLVTPIIRTIKHREYTPAVIFILQAMQSAQGDHPERVKEWKEVII